jgi:hypothetical protein
MIQSLFPITATQASSEPNPAAILI